MQEKETNAGKGDKCGKRRQMREKETNVGKGDKRGKRRQTREDPTSGSSVFLSAPGPSSCSTSAIALITVGALSST